MFGAKLLVWAGLGVAIAAGTSYFAQSDVEKVRKVELKAQLDDSDASAREARVAHWSRNNAYAGAFGCWALLGVLLFAGDAKRLAKKVFAAAAVLGLLLSSTGCRKPFEPVKLEQIGTSEEGFLIPLTGDGKDQAAANSEEYYEKNLVYVKQVRIPQQWISKGYETFGWNGEWQDAAKLIKVDRSPVTREWTADENSGTSNKNEAIWVMTSDQVEFSTGWTITARIEGQKASVTFLHNYPAGTLKDVLDTEVRAKLQAVFGLEVTDLPMDELRKNSTPHINNTVKAVTEFFEKRGIAITNLGITGGFVYKDKSIQDTMVKVFNAEQQKALATAATVAQEEKNKTILLEAKGKAEALMLEAKAKSDSVKLMADATMYEIEKAAKDPNYFRVKQLEIEKARWEKWGGSFPTTLMGATGGMSPNLLLGVSMPEAPATKSTTATAATPPVATTPAEKTSETPAVEKQ
jgi:regulator of protease activity HflC (stomatin/prohibitin superfamily)